MCEDHSSGSSYELLRTLPFSLVLKNKTIHGDLKFNVSLESEFHIDSSDGYTVWKSTIKRDHDFYGKMNIFFVKSPQK